MAQSISKWTDNKNLFADSESQFIYQQRDLYNKTNDLNKIKEMCFTIFEERKGVKWKDVVKKLDKSKKVVAFGCGAIGKNLYSILTCDDFKIDFYCDNKEDKWGNTFMTVPIISPQELKKMKDHVYIIISTSIFSFILQVKKQLDDMGIPKESIIFSCDDMGRQYFDIDKIKLGENETFIDAGCFNGDDSCRFIEACDGKYQHIFSFEPDLHNFENCILRFKGMKGITLLPYGLWSQKERIPFLEETSGNSHIDDMAANYITVISLDEILKGHAATYIKMDIEGSEMEALKGARQTIINHKPMLAICVYHKPNDIYEIPRYLKELVPEYNFYLRHYSMGLLETVLYAVA